jgi:chromate transporter
MMSRTTSLAEPPTTAPAVSLREATRVWVEVALNSFGGPAGQIAVMHRILVEERRWIGERRFLHALNYCMLLPGPEAQQLATYIGWLLHGYRGGLIAGGLFVLPGFATILALSLLYTAFADTTWLVGLFFGLKAAVLAVVVQAVVRIGRRVLHNRAMLAIAAAAFVALYGYAVPFPLVVVGAGVVGLVGAGLWPATFAVIEGHGTGDADVGVVGGRPAVQPSFMRAVRITAICVGLWLLPFAILVPMLGSDHVLVKEGVFFSKAAMVTFGGAYSVLSYIAQQAVESYGWLRPGEMLDGLAMAETTPGPLIQVVQFVGYMGAYRNPGPLDPYVAAILGSVITAWVTFVPCFLWIFLGAPYIEALQGNRRLAGGLSAITAAVVGVICNLALWLGLHVLFGGVQEVRALGGSWAVPELGTLAVGPLILALGSAVALLRFKVGMIRVLVTCAALGLVGKLWLGA